MERMIMVKNMGWSRICGGIMGDGGYGKVNKTLLILM